MLPDEMDNTKDGSKIVKMNEDKAFDFFFRRYYTSLCFFANSILKNEDEAKDIVQDCFVTLWNNQTINEKSDTIKSFLYTVVRNRCVDFLRRKKVKKKAEAELIKINNDSNFEYFDEVAFAEMMRQILDHLDELPSKMQEVLRRYYIHGEKYMEIAKDLNSSPEAIRKQKARAIELIRKKLLFLLSFLIPISKRVSYR